MKNKIIVVGIIFAAFILIIAGVFMITVLKQNSQMDALTYSDVDMSKVKDGTFTGKAETSLVKVTVEVAVSNHTIEDVQITRHENGKGYSAEGIVSDIISQNRCDVDAVSGATVSSIVIKSAVHDALIQGIE